VRSAPPLLLLAAALAAVGAVAAADRRAAACRRLRRMSRPPPARPVTAPASPAANQRQRLARGLAALTVGGSGLVLLGGVPGVVVAAVAGTASHWLLGRERQGAGPRASDAAPGQVPVTVDLLAAALGAGCPWGRALDVVGRAMGGSTGDALCRSAAALALGADAATAFGAGMPGAGLGGLRRALVRTADSGASAAGVLEALCADLRSARAMQAETAASRAGVLAVLPLALCFLPAFVLLGLVPVVAGLAGGVLDVPR
jgi:Flp pilus assembly protein TadB